VLELGLFSNYNMFFSFLNLIFTTLVDLGEVRSRDLLVGVGHYKSFDIHDSKKAGRTDVVMIPLH